MADDGKRERILEVARREFFTLGFSKVTMDEIAHELGMSKKTLYRFFPGKEALLREAMLQKVDVISAGLAEILEQPGGDFVGRLQRVFAFFASQMPQLSHAFLRDMQRHAGTLWEELDRRRQRTIRTQFGRCFREGIEEGIFKKDLHPEILILMMSVLVQQIINPETLSRLPVSNKQALDTIFDVIFQGILTSQGRARYRRRRLERGSR